MQEPENVEHIISGCSVLAPTDYMRGHNNIAKVVHQEICLLSGLLTDKKPYFLYEPLRVMESDKAKIYWDRSVITDRETVHNRPDIVYVDKEKYITCLIDVSVPVGINVTKKRSGKIAKYQALSEEVKAMWGQKEVKIVLIIIGALGEIPLTLRESFKSLNMPPTIQKQIQKIAVLETTSIVQKIFNIS